MFFKLFGKVARAVVGEGKPFVIFPGACPVLDGLLFDAEVGFFLGKQGKGEEEKGDKMGSFHGRVKIFEKFIQKYEFWF